MNKQVEELVEWVANKIIVYTCCNCEWEHKDAPHCNSDSSPNKPCEYQLTHAKQILSHPDLALIDREKERAYYSSPNAKPYPNSLPDVGTFFGTPLTEELKEK